MVTRTADAGSALTAHQRETLCSALGRILPDDADPGARAADVDRYADREVRRMGVGARRQCLLRGLVTLDSVSMGLFGHPFSHGTGQEQDEVIRCLQDIPHPTIQRFNVLLIRMALRGFLCSPVHGGNRNKVGWDFIGFRPHRRTMGA